MTNYEKMKQAQDTMTDFEEEFMQLVSDKSCVSIAEIETVFAAARKKILAKECAKQPQRKSFELPNKSPFTKIIREQLQ